MITEVQLRAARALLNWTQDDLASKSGLSTPTIKRMEKIGLGQSTLNNVQAVETALSEAGVTFLSPGDVTDGGYGVRLTKKPVSLLKLRKLTAEQQMEEEQRQQDEMNAADEAYRNAYFKKFGHYPPEDE